MGKLTLYKRKLQGLVLIMGLILAQYVGLINSSAQSPVRKSEAPEYPSINYGTGQQAEQLKRGEYLVKLGDCIACHTEHHGGQPFAGGLGFKTPFGTLYSPNITPDKATGIGNWSLADFTRAMHEGISKRGHYYYPAFPFYYFNRITDQDIADIKAYLDVIPPIQHKNYSDEMMLPFNWRFLQLGWRIMFFNFVKTGPYKLDPQQSAQWNRGAYLVLGLGHCDMCHTQMHYLVFKGLVMAAPNMKYHLAGAFVQGYYAPNITSQLMKNVSDEQLANVFRHSKLIEGGDVQGPMAEANADSLKYLSSEDINAIATYLRSVKSASPPKEKVGTGLVAGKKIYDQYCSGCHASGAGGAPQFGDSGAWSPRLKKLGMTGLYQNAINGINAMPAKGTCVTCSDDDIKYAVQYIIQESTGASAAKTQEPVAPPPPLTLEDGQKIYNQYCASCHNGSYPGAPKLGDKAAWQPLIGKGMDVLFLNTIHGLNNMPERGSCSQCNDAQLIAAVKYMVHESKSKGNYTLW